MYGCVCVCVKNTWDAAGCQMLLIIYVSINIHHFSFVYSKFYNDSVWELSVDRFSVCFFIRARLMWRFHFRRMCMYMNVCMNGWIFFPSLFSPHRITCIYVWVLVFVQCVSASRYTGCCSVYVVVNFIKMRVHLLCQLIFSFVVIARAQNMFIRFFVLCFPIPILFFHLLL